MSDETVFIQDKRFTEAYREYAAKINYTYEWYIKLRHAVLQHEDFRVIEPLLQRGYEATRTKLEAEFFEEMRSLYYRLIDEPAYNKRVEEHIKSDKPD